MVVVTVVDTGLVAMAGAVMVVVKLVVFEVAIELVVNFTVNVSVGSAFTDRACGLLAIAATARPAATLTRGGTRARAFRLFGVGRSFAFGGLSRWR